MEVDEDCFGRKRKGRRGRGTNKRDKEKLVLMTCL